MKGSGRRDDTRKSHAGERQDGDERVPSTTTPLPDRKAATRRLGAGPAPHEMGQGNGNPLDRHCPRE